MIITNTKTNTRHSVRPHTPNKQPAYFPTSEKRRKVTIDGQEKEMVCHPKRTGPRVNFEGSKNTWLFVDDQALYDLVLDGSKAKLEFTTSAGRLTKDKAEEPTKAPAKSEAATA